MDHWKGIDLEITYFKYHHDPPHSDETITSQTSNFKHVEIMNVSDKPIYDTSLERS